MRYIDLPGPTMAAYRSLFAGLCLLPFLRFHRIRLRPAMGGMVVCFATMNASFVTAMTLTTAANAILLQYTAPVWMLLGSVFLFKESLDRLSLLCLGFGLAGVAVILVNDGMVSPETNLGLVLALLAGLTYGGIGLFLRHMRHEDPIWLTVLNHLGAGLLLVPLTFFVSDWHPQQASATQMLGMAAFGIVQMGIPYILFAKGLQKISAQEGGIVTLLEPVLNPVFTYLAVAEVPSLATVVGGSIILTGVALRLAQASVYRVIKAFVIRLGFHPRDP